jgi:hypothetical protein
MPIKRAKDFLGGIIGTVVVILALAVLVFFGEDDHYQEGVRQAQRDLEKGELAIASEDGKEVSAYRQYTALLRERYKIGWIIYSLPAKPKAVEDWVRGFNLVMLPEIQRRYGSNVLDLTMAEAIANQKAVRGRERNLKIPLDSQKESTVAL